MQIENQPIFESLISTLEHFTKDHNDFSSAKLAFTTLSKMATTWGGPDVVAQNGSMTGASPQPVLPGFDRFMIERFSPLVWALPGNTEFNPRDAQARQVLGEAAGMQNAIYTKTGQEYIRYLEETELRNLGLDPNGVREYIEALTTSNSKKFRSYFQVRLFSL
jgi:exportin-T